MAYGFRNREHFKTAIYFHCGGLDLYPATHGKPGRTINKCQVHIPSGASRFDLTFVADVPPADYRWHYQPARLRLTAATTLAHGPFAPSGL